MYKINIQTLTYWIFTQGLVQPNGVLFDEVNNRLLTCSWTTSGIQAINMEDSTNSLILQPNFALLDGMAWDYAGNFYLSSWVTNTVYRYDHNLTQQPVVVSSGHNGPADIFINQQENLLVVPNFNGNTVEFVDLSQELANIFVNPNEVTLLAGNQQQFAAQAFDVIGNKIQITPIWSTTGGTITETGLYSAADSGDFIITVSAEGSSVEATATVHVDPGELARIDVTPKEVILTAGNQQQFQAKGYDAFNNELFITIVWSTDGGTIDEAGLYSATEVGDFIVIATLGGGTISDTAAVHVNPGALSRIEVSPTDVSLNFGDLQQFQAAGYDGSNNELNFSPVWSTDGGTIDAAGLFRANEVGDFTVTATDTTTSVTGTANVTVIPTTVERRNQKPTEFALLQNYPNPFNPETTIEFSVKEKCFVQLNIFDITGRQVATLLNADFEAGFYRVNFDARNLATGVYLYRIEMKDFVEGKKMVLLE